MALSFKVAARALRHLGAELITSDEMALNELLKNAFDAGSPRVEILINYPMNIDKLRNYLKNYILSKITLEEMLTKIENNTKLYYHPQKECIDLLEYIQKNIDNITTKNLDNEISKIKDRFYNIQINDTGNGMSRADLESVFLTIGTASKLNIEKNDDRTLLGEKGIGRLSMMRLGNLAKIKSKTIHDQKTNVIDFNWLDFDNPNLFINDISISTYEIDVDNDFKKGTKILISDLVSDWSYERTENFVKEYIQRLQNPISQNTSTFPIDIIQNGKRLSISPIPKWLTKEANLEASYYFTPNISSDEEPVLQANIVWKNAESAEIRSWTIEELIINLDDTKENKAIYEEHLKSLGKLNIRFYWFNRNDLMKSPGYTSAWKKELNYWVGGFGIFRDGFRVGFTGGLNDDWLRMDRGALKSSGYSFNRYQTIGEITISKKDNPCLKDTASRQSLIENIEFELLKKIISTVIIQDIKKQITAHKILEDKISQEYIVDLVEKTEDSHKRAISSLSNIIRKTNPEDQLILNEVQAVMKNQSEIISKLNSKIENINETNTDILELANLGQMVDIISHELARITENTSTLLKRLKTSENKQETTKIMEELRKQIIATEKRIKSIDILSPAVRQRKETYNITAQFKTLLDSYKPRFERHSITSKISVDEESELTEVNVTMVRGLVAQIMENLLTNSVYWLKQGIKPRETERNIHIDIDSKSKVVFIRDNGPGISPEYKEEVFKPYFTNRKNGKGLGLYIASEIARYHGAKLYLLNKPEEDNRLRTFVIELPTEA